MATLPDLDTASAGPVAYWNALNHGVADIDPTGVLSNSSIQSYTQYDNGVEGKIEQSYSGSYTSHTRNFDFRVKDDGWFVVYLDRTNNFGVNQSEGSRAGYIDMVLDWLDDGNVPNVPPHTASSRLINVLRQELSNSGSISFSHSDVGYYNYEYSNATSMYMAVEQTTGSLDGGLSYTSGTNRDFHAVGAETANSTQTESFGGVTVYNGGGDDVGIRDVISAGIMPSSGTVYSNSDSSTSNSVMSHIIFYH